MEVYEAAHGAAAQLNQKQADAEPVPLRVSLRASAPKSDADGICARRAVSPMCKFRCTGGGEPKLDEEEPMGIVEADGVLWKATRPHQFRPVPQEIQSCWDLLVERCRSTPKGIAAGNRPVLERSMEGKFEKLVLGSYVWSNYATYLARAEAIAAGLCSQAGLKAGDKLVIYAETQLEWLLCAWAAWRQGATIVTIYATLGEEGAIHGLNQTEAAIVVADAKLLKVLAKVAKKCPMLKTVVSIRDEVDQAMEAELREAGVLVRTLSALEESGTQSPVDPAPAGREDVAVLMYTSGTTGPPKGVLISHSNILHACEASFHPSSGLLCAPELFKLGTDPCYLAYLPLAHIMELLVEVSLLRNGVALGYGSPHTLLATSVKMKQTVPAQTGDAAACRPTLMLFAPAVLDAVYGKINARVAGAKPLKQKLFRLALASGRRRYALGCVGASCFWNKIVFKKVQALLGGRCRLFVCGSAPLAPDVQAWVQSVFNAPCRQGYGLTETTAVTTVGVMHDNTTSQVGPPQESACIRLRDWEEGGYLNADLDKPEIGMRRGEVLVGGPTVCKGYFVNPNAPEQETATKNQTDFVTIGGTRYFCTGDIGQITSTGCLQIIDRKKDLVKLQNGEYVALSKVENVLKASAHVELPMVYARSNMTYCIALICPRESGLHALADKFGLPASLSLPELCNKEEVVAAVLADVQATCKERKLATFETPKKVILVSELWTQENELLTAAMKLKRKPIVDKHLDEINAAYI